MAWADIFSKIAEKKPIIHCITNIVTVNDCANVLLAIGASPVMAHHEMEVKEITSGSDALVCNMGAIENFEAMLILQKIPIHQPNHHTLPIRLFFHTLPNLL